MIWLIGSVVAVLGLYLLNRFLRRRESEGHWDKEGFGSPEHPEPGVKFRPLEVPGKDPFD